MSLLEMLKKIDAEYNIIDTTPYPNKTEAYTAIETYYSHMTGLTTYPVEAENKKTKYFIVQSEALK